jgi:hypothetical protein
MTGSWCHLNYAYNARVAAVVLAMKATLTGDARIETRKRLEGIGDGKRSCGQRTSPPGR